MSSTCPTPLCRQVLSQSSLRIRAKSAEDWAYNELNVQAVLAAMGVGNAISTLLAGWFAAAWPSSKSRTLDGCGIQGLGLYE